MTGALVMTQHHSEGLQTAAGSVGMAGTEWIRITSSATTLTVRQRRAVTHRDGSLYVYSLQAKGVARMVAWN